MCIKDTNAAGEDLYINVMSWTRIMMPTSADHPIPLYGGMRVSSINSSLLFSYFYELKLYMKFNYYMVFLKVYFGMKYTYTAGGR